MSRKAAAKALPLTPAPSTFEDFVDGRPITFTARNETVTFTFSDDVWYIGDRRKPNQTLSRVRLSFGPVPVWLKIETKRHIAHLWLAKRQSFSRLDSTLDALVMVGDALGSAFRGPVASLTRFHAQRIADDFARQARIAIPIVERTRSSGRKVKNKALAEAGVRAPLTLHLAAGSINRFAVWLRRDPALRSLDFQLDLTSEIVWTGQRGVGGADESKVIDDDVLTEILRACDADYEEYVRRRAEVEAMPRIDPVTGRGNMAYVIARATLQHWQNKAVMAQAARIQFLAARRAGASVLLPVKPKIKRRMLDTTDGPRPAVFVWFRAFKMHGELGAPEPIPFPGYFGDVVLDAIQKAQSLTADMREATLPEYRDLLFLQWGKGKQEQKARSKRMAVPLAEPKLQMYYNSESRTIPGLVQRRGIKGAEHLTLHNARHTMATEIVNQGGSTLLAARYLGHIVDGDGDDLMAKIFYLAGGTPEQRQRMKDELERGLGSGRIFDALARLATRIAGGAAEAAPIPPNELTYEEAVHRIRQRATEVIEDDLTREQVIALLGQGLVIQYTSYGGCILPAKTGPCPTAEKCPIGIEPEAPETLEGEGCPYQVLMPHAREHLVQEIAMMEAKIEWYKDKPEYAFWLAREQRQVMIWRRQVAAIDRMVAEGKAGPAEEAE